MATKLNAEQLVAARQFWYECGQNIQKTAEKLKLAQPTIRRYRDEFEWVKWAKAADEKTAEAGLLSVAARRAKILKLGDDYLERLKPHVKHGQIKAQSVGGEIQKLAQTSELLTGGATERIDFDDLVERFVRMPAEERRKFIDEIRRRAGD